MAKMPEFEGWQPLSAFYIQKINQGRVKLLSKKVRFSYLLQQNVM